MEIALRDNSNELTITIDGRSEEYSLATRPKDTSMAVVEEKKQILHEIDLPSIVTNLQNSAHLLDIAYNAVNGTPMHSKVYRLQDQLLRLNNESIITIQKFGYKSDAVIRDMLSAFEWLTACAEDMAIDQLKACATHARDMRIEAENMHKNFQTMAEDTSTVVQETIEQQARNYEKKEAVRQQLAEFQAKQDALSAVQRDLKTRISETKEMYSDLNSKLEQAEKKQETLQIVSLVCGSLSAVAAPLIAMAASNPGGMGGAAPTNAQTVQTGPQSGSQQKPAGQTPSELTRKESEITTAQQKLNELSGRIDAKKKEMEALEQEKTQKTPSSTATEEEKAAAQKSIADVEAKLTAARAELETLTHEKTEQHESLQRQKAALEVLQQSAASLDKIAESTQKAADSAQTGIDASRARVREVFANLMELQKTNTENLAQLAEFTTLIKNTVITKDSLETAIQSLMVAITCLKNVVVILQDIALFWAAMEACCASLGDARLTDMLTKLQQYDEERRRKLYYSNAIAGSLFTGIVRWVALHSICADYVEAAQKTRAIMNDAISAPEMDAESHWKKASELAATVGKSLQLQVNASQEKMTQIAAQEQDALKALA